MGSRVGYPQQLLDRQPVVGVGIRTLERYLDLIPAAILLPDLPGQVEQRADVWVPSQGQDQLPPVDLAVAVLVCATPGWFSTTPSDRASSLQCPPSRKLTNSTKDPLQLGLEPHRNLLLICALLILPSRHLMHLPVDRSAVELIGLEIVGAQLARARRHTLVSKFVRFESMMALPTRHLMHLIEWGAAECSSIHRTDRSTLVAPGLPFD